MGSTGEPDRKRRHFSSITPTATAAKKQQFVPLSGEKKVQELKQSDQELRLILEMYRLESIDPRDILDARDSEFRAWALVQSMKSSLDEHNLELRVKKANEAEATSQQRLAFAEAEISDLRQKLEASKRGISFLMISNPNMRKRSLLV